MWDHLRYVWYDEEDHTGYRDGCGKKGGKEVPQICADIVFDHVDFAYNEEREILKDISVRIPMAK